ncbi:RIP metalloprotease RseP [Vitreimonas flagellata]|uniref:RIP metalloprotease RseP n=1 Tax=Vitreimonas flagellata TaxID=2560861 RepID=UPI001074A690|nr:RIP metalloprotease RseP [Vitreimonas flagellata]
MDVLQNILTYAGSFVLVLSVVVFVHEFGHFQVARWRGVAIDTFSIGFGKTLVSWRDKQGVEWKIGALPLGGYVKFADDADAMSTAPREKIETPEALAAARAKGLFHAQPLSTRSMVVAAGPFTNFVFSILAFALLALIMGRETTDPNSIPARIATVAANSAAQSAGLQPGDVIVSIDGVTVRNFSELQAQVAPAAGRELAVVIERDGSQQQLQMTPTRADNGRAILGVSGPLPLESERVIERFGPLEAIGQGAANTWGIIAQTGEYIGAIFSGRESGDQIAGPLGIINVSGQVASSALSAGSDDTTIGDRLGMLALSLLNLAAVLSVAVGFVNLLPIPILDGGHLLFYGIEALRGGKPLPPSAQEWAYRAGFAVMASLFLFATWNDITRLFPGVQ